MKKIFVIALAMVLAASMAFAIEWGQPIRNTTVTIASGTTGTVGTVTTTAYTFDYVMDRIGCDFVTFPSGSATSVPITYQASQGSGQISAGVRTYFFDLTYMTTSPTVTLTSSLTATVAKGFCVANKPFRTLQAFFTSPSTTMTYQINCSSQQ